MKYDVIIGGSGLTGALCAYKCMHEGKKVLILEKRNISGGLCRSEKIELGNGCFTNAHIHGPHIFHTNNKKVWDFVNKITPFRPLFLNVKADASDGRIYSLPFNLNLFNQLWGVKTPYEANEKIKRSLVAISNPKTVEELALSSVGSEIYEKFIKGYTEKQWGKKCSELPSFILKRIPINTNWDNRFHYSKYSGIPEKGWTHFIDCLMLGCEIKFGVDFLDEYRSGTLSSNEMIYTGRIDEFFNNQFGELEYRYVKHNHRFENCSSFQGCPVINFTSINIPFTRQIEHKHFEPYAETNKTFISVEQTFSFQIEGSFPAYPILTEINRSKLSKYMQLAKRISNVKFFGRLAEYKYYDMDTIIELLNIAV